MRYEQAFEPPTHNYRVLGIVLWEHNYMSTFMLYIVINLNLSHTSHFQLK